MNTDDLGGVGIFFSVLTSLIIYAIILTLMGFWQARPHYLEAVRAEGLQKLCRPDNTDE